MSKSTDDLISLLKQEQRRIKKTKTRTISLMVTEEKTNQEREKETEALIKIDVLYQQLEQLIKTIPSLPALEIPEEILEDFILKSKLYEYQLAVEERDTLISNARRKMHLWHDQSGYHTDLEKLLANTLKTIAELNVKTTHLYPLITDRIKLIAPDPLDHNHLSAARDQLKSCLECFLLSFCSINWGNDHHADTQLFKEQLLFFIKELIVALYKNEMRLNHKTVKTLDLHLRQHLGLLSISERVFTRAKDQPVQYTQIEDLLKDLFPAETALLTRRNAERQVAEIYNLAAKIDAFPIQQIIDFNTLASSEKLQNLDIRKAYDELERTLNALYSSLHTELSLFTGYEHRNHTEVRNARILLHQIELNRNQRSLLMADFKDEAKKCSVLQSPFQRLDQVTSIQQKFLQKISKLQKQTQLQHGEVQKYLELLKEHYRDCRYDLSHQLQTAITQTKIALQSQTRQQHSEDIAQIENLVPWFNDISNRADLISVKTRAQYRINQLGEFVREFKKDLKITWAKVISSFLSHDMPPDLIKRTTELRHAVILLDSYRVDRQTLKLHQLNPFNTLIEEFTRLSDNQISDLINEFSNLNQIKEEQLAEWIKSITQLSELTELIVSKRSDLIIKAECIEKRLISKPYLTSIHSIKILEAAFIKIVNARIDEAIIIIKNKALFQKLSDLKQHPPPFYD